jgi:hypothetical protein
VLGNQEKMAFVTGDANGDNKLDILDWNMLFGCYSDIQPPRSCDEQRKLASDLDDDGSVTLIDLNLLVRELSVQPGQ